MSTIGAVIDKNRRLLNERRSVEYTLNTHLFNTLWVGASEKDKTILMTSNLSREDVEAFIKRASLNAVDAVSKAKLIEIAKALRVKNYSRLDIETLRMSIKLEVEKRNETD